MGFQPNPDGRHRAYGVAPGVTAEGVSGGAHRPGVRCRGVPWASTESLEKKLKISPEGHRDDV
jgi:hypothetical protein